MINNRVYQNAKWIIVCKIIQSFLQLIVNMLSARYLGPSNYGLISYAASVVAFAVPLMQLGMSATVVQEYVRHPEKEGEILGTCLGMNLISGLACIIGIFCFTAIANRGERETIVVCVIYSTSLLFQAAEIIKYWFQAKLLSKYSSVAMLCAHVVVSAYKIFLLVKGKSVYWFAISCSIEYGVVGIILLIVYKRVAVQKISFSCMTAKEIFSRSKYYIMASMMVTIFQNTDHVMLKMIVGDTENGFYATAVGCAFITSFVYVAIIDSVRPVILESRMNSQESFEKHISQLYSLVIYATLSQSVCVILLAKPIVLILYGQDYLPAVPVLRIIVWQLVFSYMGTVRNIWILGEEKYDVLWRINLVGAIANIILNAFMIPVWGACGAAFASVLTQFLTNFVLGFLMKPIRRNNDLLLRGLNPRYVAEMISELKK